MFVETTSSLDLSIAEDYLRRKRQFWQISVNPHPSPNPSGHRDYLMSGLIRALMACNDLNMLLDDLKRSLTTPYTLGKTYAWLRAQFDQKSPKMLKNPNFWGFRKGA